MTFSAILEVGCGAAVGTGFGCVLVFIESRFQRVIRFGRLALSMLLITLAVFGLAYFAVFHWGWSHPLLIGHAIVFVACSGAATLLARSARRDTSRHRNTSDYPLKEEFSDEDDG